MLQGKRSGLPQGFWIKWWATIRYIQKKLSLVNCHKGKNKGKYISIHCMKFKKP
jgi:hypothetical protein